MSAPNDEAVHDGIKAALANLTTVKHVRPNKLRKLVVKQVDDCTWTQFQTCLEDMIASGDVKTSVERGEKVILVDSSSKSEGNSAARCGRDDGDNNQEEQEILTATMEIPSAVAQHLTRKGRRKQKNIEQTTKTKLVLVSSGGEGSSKKDVVALDITKQYSYTNEQQQAEEGGESDADIKERATKQLNAAKLLIENMIKSYRAHPDRYTTKKAGGTFAEQDKAKKLKVEGAKFRAKRHHKLQQAAAGAADGTSGPSSKKKKKKRKFY